MGRGKGMAMIPVLGVALLTDYSVKYIYIWWLAGWWWLDLLCGSDSSLVVDPRATQTVMFTRALGKS